MSAHENGHADPAEADEHEGKDTIVRVSATQKSPRDAQDTTQAQATADDSAKPEPQSPVRPTNRRALGNYPVPIAQHEALSTYVQRARNVSIFSIAFTLCCAGVGLGFSWSTHSSALLAYGLEALVDVWSSVLVLWRFWSDPGGEGQYFITTRRREDRASVGIAFTFILIYLITSSQAIVHLVEQNKPENSEVLLAISGTSVIILTWSCAMKYSLSKVLDSEALYKDALTSGACATMAASMLVSTTVFKNHPGVWWLDAVVALCIALLLGAHGVHTLISNDWWKREFWVDGVLPNEERPAQGIMKFNGFKLPFFSGRQNVDAAAAAVVEQELVAARQRELDARHLVHEGHESENQDSKNLGVEVSVSGTMSGEKSDTVVSMNSPKAKATS